MLLSNLVIAGGHEQAVHISVKQGLIASVGKQPPERDTFECDFKGARVIPGLINSHDHLDFNCFQPLGRQVYANYTEWGREIHQHFRDSIRAVLNIPQRLRIQWGMYKNLIAGVTTVVHHGPLLPIPYAPLRVFQDIQNLHSTAFEKNWKWKLNNPLQRRRMLVIHTGEGTDKQSGEEIDELIRFNFTGRQIVGIHGVAMNHLQAKKLKALVWCPESNQLLLDAQPDIPELKKHIRIVLGTDSTLTASWDIWQHLRFAETLHMTNEGELLDMCTSGPASLWGLNRGAIVPGREADLVILKEGLPGSSRESLFKSGPEDILMIICRGKIRLYDASLQERLQNRLSPGSFSKIYIGHSEKHVEGDLPALTQQIKLFHPEMAFPFHFGKKIAEAL